MGFVACLSLSQQLMPNPDTGSLGFTHPAPLGQDTWQDKAGRLHSLLRTLLSECICQHFLVVLKGCCLHQDGKSNGLRLLTPLPCCTSNLVSRLQPCYAPPPLWVSTAVMCQALFLSIRVIELQTGHCSCHLGSRPPSWTLRQLKQAPYLEALAFVCVMRSLD